LYLALQLGAAEKVAWAAVLAGQIVLLWRLALQGLLKPYRFFSAFLLAHFLQTSSLFLFKPGSNAFALAYMALVPVIGICSVLAISEVYDLVLSKYPGVSSLGRWVVSGGLAVAMTIAILTLSPDLGNPNVKYPILHSFNVFQRAIYSALLIYVLIIIAFLFWFPVPLSRNTVVHTVVFSVNFFGGAGVFLILNVVGQDLRSLISTLHLFLACACLAAWILLLKPSGEAPTVVLGHRWDPVAARRLVSQLDTINSSLLRLPEKNRTDSN
jgi:hypothetical protein